MNTKNTFFSAFCITAPRSGEGKTTLSMGLMRLLAKKYRVQAFKCGPDYVDTSYHAIASKNTSYNIDTWLMGESDVQKTFATQCHDKDIAIIEGVMGFFDGKKFEKSQHTLPEHYKTQVTETKLPSIDGSTASIARLLSLPVILVIDCKGMAQSISAIVRGFYEQAKDYNIQLVGIIANNIGSERHYTILKESLAEWNLPPLLGYIPKNLQFKAKERQLGLSHIFETNEELENALDSLATILEQHINIELLLEVTKTNKPILQNLENKKIPKTEKKLGIAYDKAFCFYYPNNIEYLKKIGYSLHFFSPLSDKKLPNVDALYFGGGYPEIYANELSNNSSMRHAIYNFAEDFGHIFAECGGYMYLCSALKTTKALSYDSKTVEQAKENTYAMCNVIQGIATMGNKLRSLGYREGIITKAPFFCQEQYFRGHEFHWSDIELLQNYEPFLTINTLPYGVNYKNVYASYIHIYFANLLIN